MPYVPVPKDLTTVKTKVAFNLTKRQLICFGFAGGVGAGVYLLCRTSLGNDISVLLLIAAVLPFFFFAMYERDGLPFEKVLRNMIRVKFLYPAVRPYRTENLYRAVQNHTEMRGEVRRIVRERQKAEREKRKRGNQT